MKTNGRNEKPAKKRKAVCSGIFLGLLLAIFWGMFALLGPGIYNDSDQYIKMHIHREPLYPLFLAALRRIAGEDWLTVMGILQNGLAAVSIWIFSAYLSWRFRLNWLEEGILVVLGIAPHMMTMLFSSLHLFLTNSVMSEALCLPLFLLFMTACFGMVLEKGKARWGMMGFSLFLAFILSLTRSQMMLTLPLWMLVVAGRILLETPKKGGRGRGKKKKRDRNQLLLSLLAVALTVVVVFSLRSVAVKTYNLVYNGRFINNTYGMVNTLTNMLYAADRSDGEGIRDKEAREFFYQMYDLTEERQANYQYAGKSWTEKVEHLEQWHDTIKYEMIEDVFYQYYDEKVTKDYIEQNLRADAVSAKIMAGIFPGCFWQWFTNYLGVAAYGLIRSVAVVHPWLSWAAVLVYFMVAILSYLVWRQDRRNPAVPVMAIALVAVVANVAAVSLTIMCLSRYMVYGFTTFYAGAYLLLREVWRGYIKRR